MKAGSGVRVRKRGSTWSYSFEIGRDENGKRHMKEKGGFATQGEAVDAGLAARIDWIHGNIGITSTRITLADYMTKWLEQSVVVSVKRSTYQAYSVAVRKRILPYLGSKYVQDIKPIDIDGWMTRLAAKGLSYGTLATTKGILSAALGYAVYPAELIMSNPCQSIRIPRNAPKQVVKRVVVTREKMRHLMARFPSGHRYHIPLLLAYHTGMRIGEILGLCWTNVDLGRGVIKIREQILRGRDKGSAYYMSEPKTASSSREIYLDSWIIDELRRWKVMQSANAMRYGKSYQLCYEEAKTRSILALPKNIDAPKGCTRKEFVCTDKLGLYIKYPAIQTMLEREELNAHSFRHTHTTELIESGAKAVDVAARLGHKDATTTEKIYTHDTDAMKKETVQIYENYLNDISNF